MKKLIVIALMLCSSAAISQPDPKVFTTSDLVWCGLDYSKVKCIGPEGFNDPYAIKEQFFSSWNHLMLSESDKYNFKEAYLKEGQTNDLSVVMERNTLPKVADLVIYDSYSIPEEDLQGIVSTYDLENASDGLGLVYIMESLNKNTQHASMYVVFFDIASKNILWSKKYVSKAGGFGFRNYWARSIYETIKASGDDYKAAYKAFKRSSK